MSFQTNVKCTIGDVYPSKSHRGRFGVELELEGDRFPVNKELLQGWQLHADGSLRGNGVEYVFSVPHDLDGVRDRMKYLNGLFDAERTVINPSHRASTHIHFNVQKEKYIHVLGMVILFTMIEPVFLRLVGPYRDGNLFCLPSYDTGDIHLHFDQWLSHIQHGPHPDHFPWRGKYSSLNINTIPKFGSLEFRVFPPTRDTDLVCKWCSWLENMMSFVKSQNDLTFHDMYVQFKHNPAIVCNILPDAGELSPYYVAELVTFGCHQGHELRRLLNLYMKGYTGEE